MEYRPEGDAGGDRGHTPGGLLVPFPPKEEVQIVPGALGREAPQKKSLRFLIHFLYRFLYHAIL